MTKQGYAFFLFCIIGLFTADFASAQGGGQNNLLPEIDPQDIENIES